MSRDNRGLATTLAVMIAQDPRLCVLAMDGARLWDGQSAVIDVLAEIIEGLLDVVQQPREDEQQGGNP